MMTMVGWLQGIEGRNMANQSRGQMGKSGRRQHRLEAVASRKCSRPAAALSAGGRYQVPSASTPLLRAQGAPLLVPPLPSLPPPPPHFVYIFLPLPLSALSSSQLLRPPYDVQRPSLK